jgi:hypothetical protein
MVVVTAMTAARSGSPRRSTSAITARAQETR